MSCEHRETYSNKEESAPSINELMTLIEQQGKMMEEMRWENILLKRRLTKITQKLESAQKEIVDLKEDLRIARLPKNSGNSSLPPSSDLYKPSRNTNRSLRKKSGRKSGGQPGHPGSTLKFSTDLPDEKITHCPDRCRECGKDLSAIAGDEKQVHQVVDISIPKRVLTNHTVIEKQCNCGCVNRSEFPEGARGVVNYGVNLSALVINLSARQYVSYNRTAEFIKDLFGITLSEGTIKNILDRFVKQSEEKYQKIREKIFQSSTVGSDETSVKVNRRKDWFHTYQSSEYTFIGHHPSRGYKAQKVFYPVGLPHSILVSDCYAMQLGTPAAAHQLCHAHLARELNAFEQAFPGQQWPKKIKALFQEATQYTHNPPGKDKVERIKNRFKKLLAEEQSKAPRKIAAFWKRMKKHQDKVFTFLDYAEVPSHNNGSEQAIRNVKVKQKVSGQFRSEQGAKIYAIARSIIDTLGKQNKNVHQGLIETIGFGPAP